MWDTANFLYDPGASEPWIPEHADELDVKAAGERGADAARHVLGVFSNGPENCPDSLFAGFRTFSPILTATLESRQKAYGTEAIPVWCAEPDQGVLSLAIYRARELDLAVPLRSVGQVDVHGIAVRKRANGRRVAGYPF